MLMRRPPPGAKLAVQPSNIAPHTQHRRWVLSFRRIALYLLQLTCIGVAVGWAPSISVFSSGYLFVLYPVLLLPPSHSLEPDSTPALRHASHHITLLSYTPPRAMRRVDLASRLDRSDLSLCATRTKPFLRGRPSNAQHSNTLHAHGTPSPDFF